MTTTDDHAATRAEIDQRDMQIANLKARCALAGYQLHMLDAGHGTTSTFVVARWGLQRELRDAAEVERFLEQAGALMNTHGMLTKGHNRPAEARSTPSIATDTLAAEILATARRWYEVELQRCALAHGEHWRDHCGWVQTYLDEQLRQRLAARGWRPAHAVI